MPRGMDPKVIKAAKDGNLNELQALVQGSFSSIRTITGDTVLHVHLKVLTKPANIPFMEAILADELGLLSERNDDEEIPLITAAKFGQHAAVKLFLESGGGSYTQMVDKLGDTALHKASRECFFLVAKELLCENHRVDQDYLYVANKDGETPLQLAVESNSLDIISLIIDNIPASQHADPSIGSALHAAVSNKDLGIVGKIMALNSDLVKSTDSKGQTPLHYAAGDCWPEGLKLLLSVNYEAAYITDQEGQTAAHIAVKCNNLRGLKVLVDECPDSCEIEDKKKQNIVHYAAYYQSGEILEYLFHDNHFKYLIHKKNDDGDTPLHVFARSILKSSTASSEFMIRNVIPLVGEHLKRVYYDKKSRSPGDIVSQAVLSQLDLANQDVVRKFMCVAPKGSRNRDLQEPICIKVAEKQRETAALKVKGTAKFHMVVSGLIAAASFQAGISVPGGFNQDDKDPINGGTSLLVGKPSFQAFVVLNTISFTASIIATFLYFLVGLGNGRGIWKAVFMCAFLTTSISLATFVMSFMASLYATTWKSEIPMYILYIAFCIFMLLYTLFVRGVVVFLRERSKILNNKSINNELVDNLV